MKLFLAFLILTIQDSDAVQLDVTIKEKDAAKMRQLHAESKSQDKYGLFSADAWIKKGGAKKKKKKGKESDTGAEDTVDSDGGNSTDSDVDVDEAEESEDKEKLLGAPQPWSSPRLALPETEPLWYMSQSKDHRHLLKHPVITSFLWYKWQRIRRYFNRNLRFFALFVYLLTWYIFQHCGNTKTSNLEWYVFFIFLSAAMAFFIIKDWTNDVKTYQKNQRTDNSTLQKESSCLLLTKLVVSNWAEALYLLLLAAVITLGADSLLYVLAGLLVIFVLREILQMFVSVKVSWRISIFRFYKHFILEILRKL